MSSGFAENRFSDFRRAMPPVLPPEPHGLNGQRPPMRATTTGAASGGRIAEAGANCCRVDRAFGSRTLRVNDCRCRRVALTGLANGNGVGATTGHTHRSSCHDALRRAGMVVSAVLPWTRRLIKRKSPRQCQGAPSSDERIGMYDAVRFSRSNVLLGAFTSDQRNSCVFSGAGGWPRSGRSR